MNGGPVPGRRADAHTLRARTIRDLQALIEALDARVPRVERAGERNIARDAAALRLEAVKRLAELEAHDG